jgi:hypothetical protein
MREALVETCGRREVQARAAQRQLASVLERHVAPLNHSPPAVHAEARRLHAARSLENRPAKAASGFEPVQAVRLGKRIVVEEDGELGANGRQARVGRPRKPLPTAQAHARHAQREAVVAVVHDEHPSVLEPFEQSQQRCRSVPVGHHHGGAPPAHCGWDPRVAARPMMSASCRNV